MSPMNSATYREAGLLSKSSRLPTCSMQPLPMTATRCDMISASVRSWVT
ncbi:MAG: hypothetical protein NWF04_05445 [Candidatus Bathyarchaeota archaeon]|nr:hypothetical protein [Candidatus Bathyarchaeota archaeon]